MKAIPDKFVNLTTEKEFTLASIKSALSESDPEHTDADVQNTYNEIALHQNEVLETFSQFTFTYNVSGRDQ